MATTTLATERLLLRQLDAGDLDAWVDGDTLALQSRTGARFRVPVEAPPLFEDDLPAVRDLLREDGEGEHQLWLLVEKGTQEPVGVAGFSGTAGGEGAEPVATTGYSVFPRFEGRGYTTEAMSALVDRILAAEEVRGVRATIPPDNRASIRVAEKLGMINTGTDVDPEVGRVLVYERRV